MSVEGYQLTVVELAAILSIAGRQTLVGFRTEHTVELTPQHLLNACCALVRDGLLLQEGDGFTLSQELAEVLEPMLAADAALVSTPGSDLYSQTVYYGKERIAVMERAPYDRYVLSLLEGGQLAEDIARRVELDYPEEPFDGPEPEITVQPEEPWEGLLKDSRLLLERLELSTGQRTGWLRIWEQGIFSWLQWTQGGSVTCAPLTAERLEKLLEGGW